MNAVERAVFDENKDPSANVGYNVMMDERKGQIGGQEEQEDEAKEEFARKYAKLRPLKTLNLILMILVTSMLVGNALAPGSFRLHWSKCWEHKHFDFDPDISCFNPVKLAISQTMMLALAAGTLHAMMRKAKSASKLSHLALKDIWFTLLLIANLAVIALVHGGLSFAEFRWFGTKLRANETLAELTEWGNERDVYRYRSNNFHNNFNNRYYYNRAHLNATTTTTIRPPWGWDKWDTERMEVRKALIKTRLVFDPVVVALASLAVLLQAVFLCRTIWTLKRSKTSAAGNIYAKAKPSCSALTQAYARFWPLGLLKLALVFIPMATAFLSYYIDYFYGFHSFYAIAFKGPFTFGLISLVCLCHWVCYVEKVRFRSDSSGGQKGGEDQEEEEIVQFCKKDSIFSALAIIVLGLLHLFLFSTSWHEASYKPILLIMAGLFASSLLYNLCLLKCHGRKGEAGKCGGILSGPGGISLKLNLQFQVNVGKNGGIEQDQVNSNVGVGQVEEEKEMEKKKPLEDVV